MKTNQPKSYCNELAEKLKELGFEELMVKRSEYVKSRGFEHNVDFIADFIISHVKELERTVFLNHDESDEGKLKVLKDRYLRLKHESTKYIVDLGCLNIAISNLMHKIGEEFREDEIEEKRDHIEQLHNDAEILMAAVNSLPKCKTFHTD